MEPEFSFSLSDDNFVTGHQKVEAGQRLMQAVSFNQPENVQKELAEGASPDFSLTDQTPLFVALDRSFNPLVELLMKAGANANHRNDMGWTPVHMAAGTDNVDALRIMRRYGAEIEVRCNRYNTALHAAVNQRCFSSLEYLLDQGVNPDRANLEGMTPLLRAAEKEDATSFKLLLEFGADRDLKDRRGRDVKSIVQQSNWVEGLQLLESVQPTRSPSRTLDQGEAPVVELKAQVAALPVDVINTGEITTIARRRPK
jgi:ankyrin repeat protein